MTRLKLTLAKRFLLWSLAILVISMAGIGFWVCQQIQDGIVHRTASTTALYVDSFIAPPLQDLATSNSLSADSTATLDKLLGDTPIGRRVEVFRVWDLNGTVIYSTDRSLIGEHTSADGGLKRAMAGKISADIGDIEGDAKLQPGQQTSDLLEIYSPVYSTSKWKVIAVAEFYYSTDDLQGDLNQAKWHTWLVVGGTAIVIYLLLALFVKRASDTIATQQRSLGEQVVRLTELLRQNDDLHQRVRDAAARTTSLNERFLRRFSAELHDGPAQDISLSLLQLDHLASELPEDHAAGAENDLAGIQETLQRAMHEVRAISAGLILPQLGDLTLADVIEHAVQAHRRRTRSSVALELDGAELAIQDALPTKIALYRLVQEALANAWRHTGGNNQRVRAGLRGGWIHVEVGDDGPGFDVVDTLAGAEHHHHLGVLGMRERVETLGGEFRIASSPVEGTCVTVLLPAGVGTGEGDG